ncbi:uncharacterized protein LOC144107015 isoform X3 [Amblyomma americanum]
MDAYHIRKRGGNCAGSAANGDGPVPAPSKSGWVRTSGSMNPNLYATKKTVAQGLLDVALLSVNATQLKNIIQRGEDHDFYTLLVVLISVSIGLQDSWRQGLRFKAKFERMKLRLASGKSNAPKKRRTAPNTPTIHRASRSSADTAATACYPAVMHEGEHVLEATKFCVLRSKHY